MCYTHYFKYSKIGLNKWRKIVKDVKKLYRILPEYSESSGGYFSDVPLKIQFEYTNAKPPVANVDEIRFNGAGDFGHETFFIERIPHDYQEKRVSERIFGFCKTGRKPYDLVVQVALLIIKHHVGNTFDLSSDGDDKDWEQAFEFVKKNFGYEFPPHVRQSLTFSFK